MGYKHALVAELEVGTVGCVSSGSSRHDDSTHRFDGLLVCQELAPLCEAVRKTYKQIKFGVLRDYSTVWQNGTQVLCEVWAYFEGDTYAPIRLGYRDYWNRGRSQYGVFARDIRNGKYRAYQPQHYMTMTDSVDRALLNVKKNLHPYRVEEIAGITMGRFISQIVDVRHTASNKASRAKRDVVEHDRFMHEMRHLIEIGHKFEDIRFKGLVVNMFEAFEELDQVRDKHHGHYVTVRIADDGGQVFDIITVMDINSATITSIGVHKTCSAQELPEGVYEKVATLSMLGHDSYVDGIGLKVNNTTYWVMA